MLNTSKIPSPASPKQARSKARRQALLDAGVKLFNKHGVDDVSIRDITQTLGYSTGSFYSYFADKTEYFVAVQRSVAAEQSRRAKEILAAENVADLSLPERLELCVTFAVTYFRKHTGLVHAALSYERRIPEGWQPNRQTTELITTSASAGLAEDQSAKLKVAIQLAFGLLVNSLLHNPGPLRLVDDDLTDHIVQALTPYLKC
ncbi:MAG: TetR/AcrR family transcriptional regulator [Arenibacterium sp.]